MSVVRARYEGFTRRLTAASLLVIACGVDERQFGDGGEVSTTADAGVGSPRSDAIAASGTGGGSGAPPVASGGGETAPPISGPIDSSPVGPAAGASPCLPGTQGCACAAGGTCGDGLACTTNVCRVPGCGDGSVDAAEACDDGNAVDADTCSNDCSLARCGDGVTQSGVEECDDGNALDTDACTSSCRSARCGDGFVQATEECDDANAVDTDACTSACRNPRCGDSFVQAAEACDDANATNTDACTNACEISRCGDGFVQATEECDDGNPVDGDSCTNLCVKRYNTVFVTSTTYTVPDLGGVSGADAICQARAAVGGLAGNYVAWISDTTSSVLSRLGAARGWVRPDGKPFADRMDGPAIFYPPSITELGTTVSDDVLGLGGYTQATGDDCSDWTLADPADFFLSGDPTAGFGGWNGTFGGASCAATFRLYCLQRDFSSPLTFASAPGRLAFITNDAWSPGGGLASADAQCTADAQSAGLPGTFRALLATNGASAASRFSTAGAPWVRVDGVPLVAQAADLFVAGGTLLAPLQVTAQGQYQGNFGGWSGGADPLAPGSAATTCNGWTDSSANATGVGGRVLFSVLSKTYAFDSNPCDAGFVSLYCLEL